MSWKYRSIPSQDEPFGFNFCAGAPVRDPIGYVPGSMSVIDVQPRFLTAKQRGALETISDTASNLVSLRRLERGIREQHG